LGLADKLIVGSVAISAVLGGTVEVLGGGKFANGAISGAYIMLLNHMGNDRPLGEPDDAGRSTTPMPDPLDYKNRETIVHDGKDYVLYDNQWLEVMTTEEIIKWVSSIDEGFGYEGVSKDMRVALSIGHYDEMIVQVGRAVGTTGGTPGLITTVIEKFKYSPTGIIVGGILGAGANHELLRARMKNHDLRVDHLRKRLNQTTN